MCKYCSKLGIGDCNEFIVTCMYPLKINGIVIGTICIDSVIIENDDELGDSYDASKHGFVLQTTVSTPEAITICRFKVPIKFCPFCGARLEEVFYTNA